VPGAALVGRDVKVFWPMEGDWFKGTITQYREQDAQHHGKHTTAGPSQHTLARHRLCRTHL